jgi:hypothetical protein
MKYQEKTKLTLLSAPEVPTADRRADEMPELVIDAADYPRAARQVRDLWPQTPALLNAVRR